MPFSRTDGCARLWPQCAILPLKKRDEERLGLVLNLAHPARITGTTDDRNL